MRKKLSREKQGNCDQEAANWDQIPGSVKLVRDFAMSGIGR
jgi:hypothetical protein